MSPKITLLGLGDDFGARTVGMHHPHGQQMPQQMPPGPPHGCGYGPPGGYYQGAAGGGHCGSALGPPGNGVAAASHSAPPPPQGRLLNPAQLALSRVSATNEPLTGESALFEGHFFLGFWHDVPSNVPVPPGQQEAHRAAQASQDLSRYKAPEPCRYGPRCQYKFACSRFHGPDPNLFCRNCACEDDGCLMGHPLRAGRDRQQPHAAQAGVSLTPLTGAAPALGGGLGGVRPPPPPRVGGPPGARQVAAPLLRKIS